MPSIKDNVDIMFSCLSGYNMYQVSTKIQDPEFDICATHCQNGTEVKIRRSESLLNEENVQKWKHFVEYPVDVSTMLWPVDVVKFEDNSEIGLVFRRRSLPKMEPIKTILYNDFLLDWHNDKTQKLIINFLKQCVNMHNNGYLYHCFDLNRMFYNPVDMSVFFDFSLSLSQIDDSVIVEKADTGIEFLPPWCDMDADNEMSLKDENYTVSAIIFRLMIGRMPYQGRLMDGNGNMMNHLTDTDKDTHIMMFEAYRKNPIFIFDANDTSNSIGLFTAEEKYIERWNSLPQNIKKMFSDALIVKNGKTSKTYSSIEWLNALEKFVFDKSKGDIADE